MWQWLRFRHGNQARYLGRRGEALAARFVKRRGMRVVARGQRLRPGELDIVAVDGETVVFIEVKTRKSGDAGHPSEAIDATKRRRLTRLALAFLKGHGLLEHRARFDVVAITWPEGPGQPSIDYYENAFEPEGFGNMHA